jgi:hypothetical protein
VNIALEVGLNHEETKPVTRNEAICTLVMLVRMAADSPVAEGEIEKTLNAGFNA